MHPASLSILYRSRSRSPGTAQKPVSSRCASSRERRPRRRCRNARLNKKGSTRLCHLALRNWQWQPRRRHLVPLSAFSHSPRRRKKSSARSPRPHQTRLVLNDCVSYLTLLLGEVTLSPFVPRVSLRRTRPCAAESPSLIVSAAKDSASLAVECSARRRIESVARLSSGKQSSISPPLLSSLQETK